MIPLLLGCCSSIVREKPRFTGLSTGESELRNRFAGMVVVVVHEVGEYLDLSESRVHSG